MGSKKEKQHEDNLIDAIKFISSHVVLDDRKSELAILRKQARKETNEIVEQILKEKMKSENEKTGPMPVFDRKKKDNYR